ncbi:MAG: protease complex subunit PrcB family protein, partial [Candidatus Sericytochromatia bacterium]
MKIQACIGSVLLIAACKANIDVQPPPSPSPSATATPIPSPTPTPGWVTETIRPTVETQDAVLAEVQRLQTQGFVTDVAIMKSYPVQIRLSGSTETVARLQEMAAGIKTITFTTLSQRSSNIHTSGTRVVTTSQDFATLWQQHTSALDTPPTVDFNNQSVLAVFAGERPTGGFTATITSVKQLAKTLTVTYKVTAPPPDAGVTQVITY